MTTRKRNEFLDIESEDEGSEGGYDSERAEEAKGQSRLVKRRRLSDDETDDGRDDEEEEEEGSQAADDVLEQEETEEEDEADDKKSKPRDKKARSESTTSSPKATKQPPRKNKTGVIYFSSLPPYLKPSALKNLLTARGFGPITKVFLSPAVTPSSKPTGQQQSTGKRNRRRMYTDGWVEFASKRTAKICAETLNATIVGGKKGGWYHDDIWNMRYLRGFKWADLMEQVQREKREAEARRRIEDSRARKEEKVFLAGVEKGKVVEGIRKKREEKESRRKGGEDADGQSSTAPARDVRRMFRQNEVRGATGKSESSAKEDDKSIDPDVQRVLGKIF